LRTMKWKTPVRKPDLYTSKQIKTLMEETKNGIF